MAKQIWREYFEEISGRCLEAIRTHPEGRDDSVCPASLKVGDTFALVRDFGPIESFHVAFEEAEQPTVRVEDLLVKESARGAGVGTALLETLIDHCRERGLSISLSAGPLEEFDDPGRPAAKERLIRFYERLGFESEIDGWRDGNMIIRNNPPSASPAP